MQIKIPKNCPCCSYPLETVNDQLFCRNAACDAQLSKKLEHFCKALGMKGFGSKTLEKLELNDITELYVLSQEDIAARVGSQKIAEKLLAEIEYSKQADLATVLSSFSIPLIGKTASQKIAGVVECVSEITTETCKQAGLGDKATANLMQFMQTDMPELQTFLPFSFKSTKSAPQLQQVANAKTVCITGKLHSFKNKSEATKSLEALGFKVTESVTKTTDYLVDEENKGSTKRTKADSLGIQIISNLENFLKENTND